MELQFVIKNNQLLDIEFSGATGLEVIGSNTTLKEVLETKMRIDNPAKTFACALKSGELDNVDEDTLVFHANSANVLAKVWAIKQGDEAGEPNLNALILLRNALMMLIKAELEIDMLRSQLKK